MGEERGEFEARFTKQKTSGQILGTVERGNVSFTELFHTGTICTCNICIHFLNN